MQRNDARGRGFELAPIELSLGLVARAALSGTWRRNDLLDFQNGAVTFGFLPGVGQGTLALANIPIEERSWGSISSVSPPSRSS
jgi:hypothetical protein